jgi:two-component system heavy metal sensor histidine kinase CusS
VIERLRRSLVLKLSLAFACTTLVLVGLGGIYLQYSLGQILGREAEDDLREEAAAVVRRLDEAPDRGLPGMGTGFQVRIYDRTGQVVDASPGIDSAVPLRVRAADGGDLEEIRSPRGVRLRVLYAAFTDGRLQVIRDFSPEARRLRRFRQTMIIRLVVTVLTAALVGYVIARKGLAPLQHLADQARNIHPEALSARLRLEDPPLELQPLTDALNQSLSRLEEAFARLSELSADMAHELRTPVHALRLEAERTLSSPDLPEATEDALVGMMETLDHMGALISQMLFLAKSEDPSTVIAPMELRVLDLFRSAEEPFESLAEERGLRLELDVPRDFTLQGDPTLLRRALHNLVDNALRDAPEGTAVVLRARELPDGAVLEISDQGEGIPEGFLASIGQRFLRSDASRSRTTGGAGLGLAIVHSIAKLHGAAFEIHSRPGAGTRARLVFPRT